ncbi:MAG: 2-succinyl-5-enolpyruvyl-6-hydroxy-3-cyclohexene-1-carboxylic-acid synthase [Flammeovirgaceae bacterium]|nr:MAG: 2-succinyl-5-enolpyruvyl-6-hydroxy-3-cyclohexene-1-carboxylic-acid synthase [Flammeovirgaceae bacterium]
MSNQPIYDIAEICARKGIIQVVLCPGSRCAPLTLAFTRHPKIRCRTFSDERSAGFVALGIARQTKQAVVLVSTSGTAGYNYAPAVAEAFFSETPLVVITADRPTEWIAQHDGQTIYQHNLYGKHVKNSYTLPQNYDHPDDCWHINRIINQAINLANAQPKGPVHVNAPFREPFYPEHGETFSYSKDIRIIDEDSPVFLAESLKEKLTAALEGKRKILVVAGQHDGNPALTDVLQTTAANLPVITGVLSNLHNLKKGIRYADSFLGKIPAETEIKLKPDLLISFGKSVISKNLKLFLRKFPDLEHWHIQPYTTATDPFQNLRKTIVADPTDFFDFLNSIRLTLSIPYAEDWKAEENRIAQLHKHYFSQLRISELDLVSRVLAKLPAGCNLHLANSMSVRYAELIGLQPHQQVTVYSNRGTSGIDGCTSTAVGHCLSSDALQVLITGDLAFFYDRNAFWHSYPMANLRVVLLNNHGGIIFKLIDGPADLPEADEYFVTRQPLTAKNICAEFGFDYLPVKSAESLRTLLEDFFMPDSKTKLLELESRIDLNKQVFENFKQILSQRHET